MSPDNVVSLLRTLELSPGVNLQADEIKKQWREMCRRYHPDAHPEEGYIEQQKKIEAGEEIPEEDLILEKMVAEAKFKEIMHAYKMLTDTSYQMEIENNKGPSVDLNIMIPISVSFEEGFFGTKMTFSVTIQEFLEGGKAKRFTEEEPAETQVVVVNIPPGTRDVYRQVLREKGNLKDGRRGDITFIITVTPSQRFVFRDTSNNIHTVAKLGLHEILTGCDKELATLYGIKTVKIPAGTVPGDVIKVINCGVSGKGYQLVTIDQPKYPGKDELKNSDDWDGMTFNWDEDMTDLEKEAIAFEKYFITLGGSGDR